MVIIPENKFLLLEQITLIKNYKDIPNIVVYSSIFDYHTINKIVKLLNKIEYSKDNVVFYSDNPILKYENLYTNSFLGFLSNIKKDIERLTSLSFNSCLIQKINWKNFDINNTKNTCSIMLGYNNDIKLKITNISSNISKVVYVKNGSLLIQRDNVQDYWYIETDSMYNDNVFFTITFLNVFSNTLNNNDIFSLQNIYLSTKKRVILREKIYNKLDCVGSEYIQIQNIEKLKKYIDIEHIGSGDWGNVYSACFKSDHNHRVKFAIKMSRISKEDLKDPYSDTSFAWYEIFMLKYIIKPLIETNVCPNLPFYINTFICNKYDFIYKEKQEHPCVIIVTELATGDLKKYFSSINFTDKHLYSALFQIMAGLHAIQMRGQIFINDIKAANILYYNVKPGGYWHYIINNTDFYVPNYGHMFVLNDFGVSTLYDPNFQLYPNKNKKTFNLGSRYAININEKFYPIEAELEVVNNSIQTTKNVTWKSSHNDKNVTYSKGATYNLDRKTGKIINSKTKLTQLQKSYLLSNGINHNSLSFDFFENPYIIPPFEFYNDVQDTLKMFIGGKRSSQKGMHKIFPNISNSFKESIHPYLGLSRGSRTLSKKDVTSDDIFRVFSTETYHVLAGSFIIKFFTETVNYTQKIKGEKISLFDMKSN